MPSTTRLLLLIFLVFMHLEAHAAGANKIPTECRNLSQTVALIDCLQDQLDILQFALRYHETVSKIDQHLANQASQAPIAIEKESAEFNAVLDRINWFDQNLEIYAVVGSSDNFTAYGRLNDRHYRLQEGDTIRLAKVKKIHARGLILTFSGHEVSIGLSGRFEPETDKGQDHDG